MLARLADFAALDGKPCRFDYLFTYERRDCQRLIAVERPIVYARSFFGIVDLLAILPTYLTVLLETQAQSLLVIRILRLLRIFRVLKRACHVRIDLDIPAKKGRA